jgi:anti-sigma28 factor (negative regulator of flagellin synthesis)
MLTKTKVLELVDHMPDEFTENDLFEKVILMQKVEQAKQQIEAGDFLTEEEFNREIDLWD